ncbi:MAG: TIGR00269 family protein [Methanomassiliicoccus sp.]|nr:MAG: TIGR00269 family protein [Methanomassiliicoccus sp.]
MQGREKQPINSRLRNQKPVTDCDKCRKKAAILIRYSGAHLCKEHFCEFVDKRVKHEIRQQLDIKGGERIAVAVSGGKDSSLALHMISKILGVRKDLGIAAITIDEGIRGYRDSSIPLVKRQCDDLDVEHIVVSFKDMFGITMDDIACRDRRLSACSYCGVLRRNAMNRAARGWSATHLATGLNLDDTSQSILMNFARGDVERLARLGPHKRRQAGLVPRIQPLRTIPESESMLYAMIKGMEFHDLECPYAPEALRNSYRTVVGELEDQFPGTRHSILKSYEHMMPVLEEMYEPAALRMCACGEPTISERCKACELIENVKNNASR